MTISQKELELLFPEQVVEVAGKDITIRPFSFAETRKVMLKLKDVLHIFNADEITPSLIAQATDKSFDGICDVIAMVYGLDRKAVPNLDNRAVLQCIKGIVEVNKSFFVEQVSPVLNDLTATMQDSPSQTES